MNIIKHRRWFYIFSALIIIPGLISMIYSTMRMGTPFHLSIDFSGGTLWEIGLNQAAQPAGIVDVFKQNGIDDVDVTTIGDAQTYSITTVVLSPEQKAKIASDLTAKFGGLEERQYLSIGPSLGAQVTRAATIAVVVASLVILGFIIFAFRNVPHPVRYGACAIIAMIHDVLVVCGIFSIMGWLAGWKVDSLFLTALLTVIGFSVQDTIVVYDRVRENTRKRRGEDFETIVNRSLLETIKRSLATQINAMFVMIALLLFGGVTIRHFVVALLIGLLSGTYSSIFNAVPLVVSWERGELNPRNWFGNRRPATA